MVLLIYDILIYSKDRVKHSTYLNTVLQTKGEHQLYSNSKKREFWLEQVVFLGCVISREGDES